jgi:hypothetical protein
MSFLKNLFSPPRPSGTFYGFAVKCKRCGETIRGQVNVFNEPSMELDEKGKPYYTCRKVLIGSGYCFQQVEVIFKFGADKRLLEREIKGGEFVEE